MIGEEKMVDFRIAIDLIRLAREAAFDRAVLFTQDQDQVEAVKEAKSIVQSQNRNVEFFSAFPAGGRNSVGVNGTQAILIDEASV